MKKDKIAIIGLGYVGLPLARLFATKYSVVGFDINTDRISELMSGVDSTLEVDNETLQSVLVSETLILMDCFVPISWIKSRIVITTLLQFQHLLIKIIDPF